jgi:diaminohydroxyphosphoribosylaminopyrimidine deaminase/5-amino-6-(5-phosphoribosylamino)uracil reductase
MINYNIHHKFMQIALNEAKKNLGNTYPNPSVGAALVKNNILYDVQATMLGGSPHAEYQILAKYKKEDLKGCSLYVTMEPCCITGKNPPCTDIIIKSGIKKIIVGCIDQNPLIKGKSIELLRKNNIEVILLDSKDAQELHRYFFSYIENKYPYVTAKIACTIDSKIALKDGQSKWITSESSRMIGHLLRLRHDAILTGVNTVNIDDPELNVRIAGLYQEKTKIVLDRNLEISLDAKLLTKANKSRVIIITTNYVKEKYEFLEKQKVEIIKITNSEYDNPLKILKIIGAKDITSLLIESGRMINKFLKHNLIDELYIFRSNKIMGVDAIEFINEKYHNPLQQEKLYSLIDVKKINNCDIVAIYRKD